MDLLLPGPQESDPQPTNFIPLDETTS